MGGDPRGGFDDQPVGLRWTAKMLRRLGRSLPWSAWATGRAALCSSEAERVGFATLAKRCIAVL